jgi:hypothetical protein
MLITWTWVAKKKEGCSEGMNIFKVKPSKVADTFGENKKESDIIGTFLMLWLSSSFFFLEIGNAKGKAVCEKITNNVLGTLSF